MGVPKFCASIVPGFYCYFELIFPLGKVFKSLIYMEGGGCGGQI
jgi:hypothetical protein